MENSFFTVSLTVLKDFSDEIVGDNKWIWFFYVILLWNMSIFEDLHSWTSIVHMTNVWCYKIHSKCRVVQWISQEHSRKEGFFDVVSNSILYLIFKKPSLAESWYGMKEKYSYLKGLHICVRPKQHGAIVWMQTQNVGASAVKPDIKEIFFKCKTVPFFSICFGKLYFLLSILNLPNMDLLLLLLSELRNI